MADWNWGDQFGMDDDEQNEEEGGYQRAQWGTKDGVIFLIDCTEPMFEQDEDESAFERCIKCAKQTIQSKIIGSDKDLLGIVFFGTKKDKNPSEFKNVYILHDLDLPGAERVLQLEALLEEEDNDDFKTQFGHSNTYSISDALWACSNMFANSSQKLGSKRILLFTNTDNPHGGNAQLRRQAAAKAEDLHQNGIDLELMHMNKTNETFDVTAFYKDILFHDDDENSVVPDPADRFEELLTRVRSKDHKKRAMGRIPFSLGKGLEFSVGIYNLVRPCYKAPQVKLYKKTNEEVKAVTKTFLAETGEVLMPQDLKKCQEYPKGGKKILFEQEEVNQIKKFDDPGIKLMGFKPTKCIKPYFQVKPAQFLYPDESNIEGSTTVFTALLTKCLEKDVAAICRYIPRRNTPPRFAALMPQAEVLDEHNVQDVPPGFHVLFMPFADDFRKIKLESDAPRANQDQKEKAKEIVKKLAFKYSATAFENPALQQHYSNVEAMALDRDSPEEVQDLTMPSDAMFEKRAGKLIGEFNELVFPEGYVPGAKKRAGGGDGPAPKKPKPDAGEIDVEKEARSDRLGKLTVAVLKECVKKLKITPDGNRKADLIDAINDHYGL